MADDTSTESQEIDATDGGDQQQNADGLGDPGKKALAEERKQRRAAERAHAEAMTRLKEFEDRDKTEAQKLEERAAAAEKVAADASRELMRLRVAAASGLGPEAAARLQGNTEDELAADAVKLKELLGTPAPPSFDQGVRTSAPTPADMNSLIRAAAGRN